jgi:hypothetical protein
VHAISGRLAATTRGHKQVNSLLKIKSERRGLAHGDAFVRVVWKERIECVSDAAICHVNLRCLRCPTHRPSPPKLRPHPPNSCAPLYGLQHGPPHSRPLPSAASRLSNAAHTVRVRDVTESAFLSWCLPHTLAEPRGSLETANARHLSSARHRSALTVTQRRLPRRALRFALLRIQERSCRLLHAPELRLPQQSVRWSPIPLHHPPTRGEFLRLTSAAPHS